MRSDLYEHSYHHLGDSESRQSLLLKYLNREQLGIEIAPWHSPLVPKKEGYQVQVLDILSTSALIERCRKDPACAEKIGNIEDVDIIASAIEIGDVIKARGQENTYDYIVSSHNFEHLSDPIYFLKGCGNVLRAGGLLSMAIPDKKYTFDYFRTLSSTADFLRAYYLKQNAPTPFQIFDFSSKFASNVSADPSIETISPVLVNDLKVCFETLLQSLDKKGIYTDTHVHVFTVESFQIILLELIYLNLIPFRIKEIHSLGCEFIVHLEHVGYDINSDLKSINHKRLSLHQLISKLNK